MANIPLQTIRFPELNNTYTIPQLDETLAVEGDAAESSAVGAALDTKADKDGAYPDLTAGLADMATQLKSTVGITDEESYLFRTSGGSADIGDFETDRIVGGTVAWNQHISNVYKNASNTPPGTNYYQYFIIYYALQKDHVVLASADFSYSGNEPLAAPYIQVQQINGTARFKRVTRTGSVIPKSHLDFLCKPNDMGNIVFGISTSTENTPLTSSDVWGWDNAVYFDITQMFGSIIADYIYSLEQATEGAGVAWFRKLFPKPYYAYNPGTLIHVGNISKHKMVGFNQWDEEWEVGIYNATTGNPQENNSYFRSKNMIAVLPNTTYYAKTSGDNVYRFYYDANKVFIGMFSGVIDSTFTTPQNAYYLNIVNVSRRTYDSSSYPICINLSWDGERDGEYAPYVKYEYPLDADFYLLGVPKLDANNRLYYDGDEYASDGTVTQRYGMVDLGTLTWSESNGNFYASISRAKNDISGANVICAKYTGGNAYASTNNSVCIYSDYIWICDSTYTDAATFKAAMSGVYLVYERAEPMYAQVDPFENPQRVDDFGTEEYVAEPFGTNDVIVPVGHRTFYQANLRAKLEMAPNSPDGDGDYIVRQANGENTYVPLVITPEVQVVNQTFEFDPGISVAAGAIVNTLVSDDLAIDVPTGYVPAMVTVAGTNNPGAFAITAQNFSVSPAKLWVTVKNTTDAAVTLSYIEANILCVKSS